MTDNETQTKPDAKAIPAGPHLEPLARRSRWAAAGLLAAGLIVSVLVALYIQTNVEPARADGLSAQPPGTSTPVKKTVLLLFPFQLDLPTHELALQAIREEFGNAADLTLDVYYEYLDLNRFSDSAYQRQLFDLYAVKYHDKPIDLVILSSERLLDVWLAQRSKISPNAPVVFYDIVTERLAARQFPPEVTGVSGVEDYTQSVKWILRARPAVNEIVIVHGVGLADQGYLQPVVTLTQTMSGLVRFTDLSHLPLAEIKRRVATLPPSAVVLYHLMFEDAAGVKYRPIDALRELTAASAVPVISGYDQFIGAGTIGGYLYSIDQQARAAAQIGLRILRGAAVSAIPISRDQTNRFVFDQLALQRFGLSLSDLPPDSLIKNRQVSVWELYAPQIIAIAASFLVLLLLVTFLLSARRVLRRLNANLETQVQERTATLRQTNHDLELEIAERQQAEAALRESLQRNKALLDANPDMFFVFSADGRIVDAKADRSDDFYVPLADFLGKRVDEVLPPDLAQQTRDLIAEAGRTGRLVQYTYTLGLHDEPKDFESRLVPCENGTFMAVVRDITDRRRVEAALTKSEAILKRVQEVVHMGSWEIDLTTKMVVASDEAHRVYGLTPGAMTLANVQAVSLPEFRPMLDAALTALITDGKRYDIEFKIQRPADGEVRDVHSIAEYNASSRTIIGAVQDITERKRAEAALRASENQYRQLVETTPDWVWAIDLEGVHTYSNSAIYPLLGYPVREVVGTNTFPLVHPADEQPVRDMLKQCIEQRVGWQNVTIHWLHQDGSVRTFESTASPLVNAAGQLVGFSGVDRDITERQRAEEKLQLSEASLQAANAQLNQAQHIASIGSWTHHPGQALPEWSDEMFWIFGLDPRNGVPTYPEFGRLFHPDEHARLDVAVNAMLTSGQGYSLELQVIRPDGRERIIHLQCEAISDDIDQTPYILGTAQDITARKQAEAEIQQLNAELEDRVTQRTAQLEAANQELEAFSYSVSHDLRAPLRAIDGFARILIEDYADKLDAEGRRVLNVVCANAQKMDQLIIGLLTLSRVTRGGIQLARVEMTALAQTVYRELAPPEMQATFTFSVAPLPAALGDPILLGQVWINLIGNAIKYTLPKAERRIEIGCRLENGLNVYFVKDSGVGFNPDYTSKLFGVFQRLHKVEEFEGTGVGLAIVQRIVLRHGGRVWAEGRLNQGATFYFALPPA